MLDWQINLIDLFQATVHQQTLEEAAELIVDVSEYDDEYHQQCLNTLAKALDETENRNEFVIHTINKSGYSVSTFSQAKELLTDFLDIYKREFDSATNR